MSVPSCVAGVPIHGVSILGGGGSGPCSVPASVAVPQPATPLSSAEPKSLPPSLLRQSSRNGNGGNGNVVESALWETRAALKDTKRKNREQAWKARQLVTAVAAKIEEKDDEMERVRTSKWGEGVSFYLVF